VPPLNAYVFVIFSILIYFEDITVLPQLYNTIAFHLASHFYKF